MAKISELSDGGSLQSTDYLIAVRSGGNVKVQANGNLSLGTVTADGLTVDGSVTINSTAVALAMNETDTTDLNSFLRSTAGQFRIDTLNDAGSVATKRLAVDHATGDISFYEDTGTTAKFFWDASAESLGIGTTSPSRVAEITSATSSESYLRISGNSGNVEDTNFAGIEFYNTDSSGAGPNVAAFIEARAETATGAGAELVFATSLSSDSEGARATERLRIDSSGNLLVGKTAVTLNTEGHAITPTYARFTRDSGNPVQFNRTTNDGDIANFYKDGTLVGSIGTVSSALYISNDDTGLQIYGAGSTDQVVPCDATGATRDNAIDLGKSTGRFKDVHAGGRGFFNLYSSGINSGNIMVGEGVYVGAANGDNQIRSSSAGGGSATLYIGNAAIQVSSDQRLKTNIVDTEMNATEKLNQVRVVDFNWDDPSDTSFNNRNARGKWTGVLAQELVDVLPFAVNAPRNEEDLSIDEESDQKWLVDQAQMVPVLIKAIQELTARIATLEGAN